METSSLSSNGGYKLSPCSVAAVSSRFLSLSPHRSKGHSVLMSVEFAGEGGTLRFSEPEFPPVGGEAHAVRVDVQVGRLQASGVVETYGDGLRLADFFDDIAAGWRGWDGEKVWYSDGVRLILKATHDGRSRVEIDVYFSHGFAYTVEDAREHPGDWRVSTSIAVEPGQLEARAAEVHRLLGRGNNPASHSM